MSTTRHYRPGLIGLLIFLCPHQAQAGFVFTDPRGDAVGTGPIRHDIAAIGSQISGTGLVVTTEFFGPVSSPSAGLATSVLGFLDLDVDQDSLTGRSEGDAGFAAARGGVAAKAGLGVD